jgi:hypothetical protein
MRQPSSAGVLVEPHRVVDVAVRRHPAARVHEVLKVRARRGQIVRRPRIAGVSTGSTGFN